MPIYLSSPCFLLQAAQLLNDEGAISKSVMADYLHLSPAGHQRWLQCLVTKHHVCPI